MTTVTVADLDIALRRQPLMREFTPVQFDQLMSIAELVDFEPNEVIHREGDESDKLFLVVRGHVAIELAGRLEVLRVETVGPGGEFGWSSMLQGAGRYFQSRALDGVQALAFDAAELRLMCEEDPRFGYALMTRLLAVVAERLQATRLQIVDMHWTPAKRAGA
jgi:CRP/FNR family transcriptional regulator, cyclic AMP receptor protein